jgi:DNA-directed RNA polymerase sigma subunit (sigma70/sigma32)
MENKVENVELVIKVTVRQEKSRYESTDIEIVGTIDSEVGKLYEREFLYKDLTSDNLSEALEYYINHIIEKLQKRKETVESNMRLLTEIANKYNARLVILKVEKDEDRDEDP